MKTFDKNASTSNAIAKNEPFYKNVSFEKALSKALFDPSTIGDNELFSLCQQYGNNAKMWKRKFEELLPEVTKRELYKKRRFVTIYEFAAKVGGLSYDTVDRVLQVYKQLEDKPILRSLVVEFGWSKLRIVSGIATVDTDASWAEKVRVLPKSSLETLVRDFRRQDGLKNGGQSAIKALIPKVEAVGGSGLASGCGLANSADASDSAGASSVFNSTIPVSPDGQRLLDHRNPKSESVPGDRTQPEDSTGRPIFGSAENDWPIMSFKVDPETEFRLRKLKIQIEKERKIKMSFNHFFKIVIERAEAVHGSGKRQIDVQKERLAERPGDGAEKKISVDSDGKSENMTAPASRYIPAQIKREIEQKYHGHCGFPGCKKSSDVYHHVRRFALNKAHNPAMIIPLCKEHHDVAHGGWVGNEQDSADRPADWELEHEEKWFLPSREIDEIWKGCRKVDKFLPERGGV